MTAQRGKTYSFLVALLLTTGWINPPKRAHPDNEVRVSGSFFYNAERISGIVASGGPMISRSLALAGHCNCKNFPRATTKRKLRSCRMINN